MVFCGRAAACGAGTIVNAISTFRGAAFALDIHTSAEVMLREEEKGVYGVIEGGGDTRLIELAVEDTLSRFDLDFGGVVKTSSEIPQASGLKSSSAAANATVLATLAAIGESLSREDAVRIGVGSAVKAGVTITGAFDDAAASCLGGVVVTNNRSCEILRREEVESEAVVYIPRVRAFSRDANVLRARLIAPLVEDANRLAEAGDYWHAMTLNGLLYCAALDFSPAPILDALEAGAVSASLSGTGPSYVAITDGDATKAVVGVWGRLNGRVIKTKINNNGAYVMEDKL
ncbi:shikimate kinase [Methanosarcinales archaeon]|nr:MAG: shikimate kinase [Methanosarcinales archaeon]